MAFLNEDNFTKTSARDDGTGKPITDINVETASIAVPVDIQFANVQSVLQTLTMNVRNTSNNWLATNQDWSHYKQVCIRATNTHNQPITLSIQVQNSGAFTNASGTAFNINIPAGATNMLITPTDLAILGYSIPEQIALDVTATTAPTTGTLTTVLYFTPLGA